MITLFISSTLLILLAAGGAVWMIHKAYIGQIDGLRSDNKDLRDRLFQSKALPPSGVDLTQKYEAKVEREQQRRDDPKGKKPLGPIEQLSERWAEDDRNKANRMNIDATQPRNFAN